MSEEKKNESIGAFWENTTRDGRLYWKGSVNDVKVVVWPNQYKKDERHPDFKVYLDKPKDAETSPAASQAAQRPATQQATPQQSYTQTHPEDDIPW